MDPAYQDAIITAAVAAAQQHARASGWSGVSIERDDDAVFVTLAGPLVGDDYLARIDFRRFPIEPYEIGFLNPRIAREERRRVSTQDPRYWPWSPMPGLDGSFNIIFARPIRVFWCRPCTESYFYYHGHEEGERWEPAKWPLLHVIDVLHACVLKARHPRHWRPLQRSQLFALAASRGVTLPEGAGADDS